MILTSSYTCDDLREGKCPSCGDKGEIIYINDEYGRCAECVEADKFYEECMKMMDGKSKILLFN